MIIKSSTTLRNDYTTISNLAHEFEEPIYITKNGEGDIVLMNIEAFEKKEQMLKLKSKLLEAEFSRTSGEPTISFEQVKAKLGDTYNGKI